MGLFCQKVSVYDKEIPQSLVLQTNLWQREEEPQNTNSHKALGRQSEATSSLFLIKMIAKLERTQNIT